MPGKLCSLEWDGVSSGRVTNPDVSAGRYAAGMRGV